MKNKKYLKIILLFSIILYSCSSLTEITPLATPLVLNYPFVTISSSETLDCKNSFLSGIKIKSSNVTIMNCNIVSDRDYAIEVLAVENISFINVHIENNFSEGSGFNITSSDRVSCTKNVYMENITVNGDVGWGITGRLCGIEIINAKFTGIGKAGGEGKHGLYINNWSDIYIENLVLENIWNSGIKMIGTISNATFKNVTCKNIGESNSYGSCVMIGEGGDRGRDSNINNIIFDNLVSTNVMDNAIGIDDPDSPPTNICVNGTCYDKLTKSIKTLSLNKTPTPTPTPTKITASTPTNTITASPTFTFTSSPSQTLTPTQTPSITSTFVFITPSSTTSVCKPKTFVFNREVRIRTGTKTLRLRAEPSSSSYVVGYLFDTRDQTLGGVPLFIKEVVKNCNGDVWAQYGGYFALRISNYYGYTDVNPAWLP